MVKVKDVYTENQENKDNYYIYLQKEKQDEFDPLIEILWEGWLKDIPEEYMEYEVLKTGESLKDAQNGITGFYIEVKIKKTVLTDTLERIASNHVPASKVANNWYREYCNGRLDSGYLLQGYFYGLSAAGIVTNDEFTAIMAEMQTIWEKVAAQTGTKS